MAQILSLLDAPLIWQDSGGSAVITLNNLAANVGRVGARIDRGLGLLPRWYVLQGKFEKGVAGVVGQIITVGLFLSDGTNVDGNVGVADAALTATQMLACHDRPFEIVVTTISTDTPIVQSKLIEIPPMRYISVGVINSVTGLLRATANACRIALFPYHDEV